MHTLFRSAAVLGATLLASVGYAQQSLSVTIASGADDVEEHETNAPGQMYDNSSDLELVRDGGRGNQTVGLRFVSVGIPVGAVVTGAYVQFTTDETDSEATSLVIRAETADNSTPFTGEDFNVSGRTQTADSVVWSDVPAWSAVGEAGPDQRTPDLSTLLQAVVSRPGWAEGNALTLIVTGTGSRTAEAYDGSAAQAPTLEVTYGFPVETTVAVSTGDDDAEQALSDGDMSFGSSDLELVNDGGPQIVGMRFNGIDVPRGVTITNAYVQFTTDETNSGTTNLVVRAEATDNSAPFVDTDFYFQNLPTTEDSVAWNNLPAWNTVGEAGPNQRTPNLAAVVQEVTDREGWNAGNSLTILIAGEGERTAESYNGGSSANREPRLTIEYIPSVAPLTAFPVARSATWAYNDSGTDLGTAWTAPDYNDSTWAFGPGQLGYGDGDENTTLSFGDDADDKHPTYYFRKRVLVDEAAVYDSLIFNLLADDGAVVYLNGTELFRQNMPAGAIDYNTFATDAVGGNAEDAYIRYAVANTLLDNVNVVAVEVHQANASSSDVSFDLEVLGKLPPAPVDTFPLARSATWSYLDNGTDPGANWTAADFNDGDWGYGPAELGYGEADEATVLGFGPDPANKYLTTYFRAKLFVEDVTALNDSLILSLLRDDGAVVYLNGTELLRSNMPTGDITNQTPANDEVVGGDENKFFIYVIPTSALQDGVNQLAVSVHQGEGSSEDLSFALSLGEYPGVAAGCDGTTDGHISCFTSLLPTSQDPNFDIPTGTHAFQTLLERGDLYTEALGSNFPFVNAPGNNDFTGFVPGENMTSSTQGWLSVNHENSPGGVSMLSIRYEDSTRLWVVDSIRAVDFYNDALVTTGRNCSGGVTPWGTILTCEETLPGGDVNNDGYEDVGWIVEIDPVTASVVSYGNGQEKLWAMGRMSHENAAPAPDSLTVYYAEDAGNGAVYKFVADEKMNLSSGTLYALKLDDPIAGTEPTGSTGEWILIPNETVTDRNNTRSLAFNLGANGWGGPEDVEVGPLDGKIYFTSKGAGKVFRFRDDGLTISEFETFVGGQEYLINHGDGIASEPWGGGNDNLCFDDRGNLYVLQDGGRDHVWMVRPDHTQEAPQVDLMMKIPSGAEPCGLTFTPDYRFGFISVQHPSGGNAATVQVDAGGRSVTMGRDATVVVARKEHLGQYGPSTGATGLQSLGTGCNFLSLQWQNGDGDRRMVVARPDAAVTFVPQEGPTSYAASNTFGQGEDLGDGQFVIYNGPGDNVTVVGLSQGTEYHFAIYEYNQDGELFFYQADAPATLMRTTTEVLTSNVGGADEAEINTTETYSVALTSGSTYEWTVTGGEIVAGAGTNTIDVAWGDGQSGTVTVAETTLNGCEGDAVALDVVLFNPTNLDVALRQGSFSVYPNPAAGETTLSFEAPVTGTYRVVLYDMGGRAVRTFDGLRGKTSRLALDGLPSGLYTVQLRAGQYEATRPLRVQ